MPLNIPKEIHHTVELSALDNSIYFEGELEDLEPEFLTTFFDKVIDQLENIDNLVINFLNLEFCNSIGIKYISDFILNLPPHIQIAIVRNPEITWQKVSLKIMRLLDKKRILIEEGKK